MVVATSPEPLAVLTDLDAPVTFRFDERISERVSSGVLATAVTVSPRSGEIRVSKGSRSLEVRPEGGFRPGLVYRVTLHAVVSDLFGNQMTDPFELVFTTGVGEPVPTTLAGEVWDRITGRAVADAVVLAESPDGLIHQSRSDRDGIYAFRYLPVGDFTVTAFEDRNRDGTVDSTEVQGVTGVSVGMGDTSLVDVPILEPDTSAANVTDAEALDSVTVVVTFDDYLPPDADPAAWPVVVTVADTTPAGVGVTAPGVERVFQEAEYADFFEMVADSFAVLDSLEAAQRERQRRTSARARPDTAARPDTTVARPDTAPARPDTAAAPADTVRIGGAGAPSQESPPVRVPPTELRPLQGERPGPTDDGRRVLPGRRIVVVLEEPLVYDVVYAVEVSGVTNLAGLDGGGGRAELVLERPPPPDSAGAAADSAGLARDTSGVVPDTSGAQPDTSGVVPDMSGALRGIPDTAPAIPDAPPGTSGTPPAGQASRPGER